MKTLYFITNFFIQSFFTLVFHTQVHDLYLKPVKIKSRDRPHRQTFLYLLMHFRLGNYAPFGEIKLLPIY